MYLTESHFRKLGVKDKTDIVFATLGSVILAVPEIKKKIM
jgi:sulfide:quinone oxidoreductase